MGKFLKITICLILVLNVSAIETRAETRKNVAVLDFANQTNMLSLEYLEKGLDKSLENQLAIYSEINLIERTRLKDSLKEVTFSQRGLVSPETAVKIAESDLNFNLGYKF